MSNTDVIQVRIPSALRAASERRALEEGLSSVQEAIRIFLKGFVEKRVGLGVVTEKFPTEEMVLSKRAEERFAKIDDDIKHNRNLVSFDDPEEAARWLTQSSK